MTDLAAEPIPATAPDTWSQQLAQLKARYKHVRPAVLVALNILLHDENIDLGDAKAQAQLHGVRITAASMNAARTLLSRMDSPATVAAPVPATTTIVAPARAPRRHREPQAPLDAEAMIRGFVERVNAEKQAEVARLKDAVRTAIAALQAVVG